jgi:hypothetical protein
MAKEYEYPIDIDPAYYSAIGQVTARWAWLEHRLSVLIREGFRVDKAAGRAWTSGMQAVALHRTIQVLVKGTWIRDAKVRKAVDDFANAVEQLRERRNNFAHGIYGPEPGAPGTLYRILMRGFNNIMAPNGTPITVREVQDLAAELRLLQERGLALTTELKKVQRK